MPTLPFYSVSIALIQCPWICIQNPFELKPKHAINHVLKLIWLLFVLYIYDVWYMVWIVNEYKCNDKSSIWCGYNLLLSGHNVNNSDNRFSFHMYLISPLILCFTLKAKPVKRNQSLLSTIIVYNFRKLTLHSWRLIQNGLPQRIVPVMYS